MFLPVVIKITPQEVTPQWRHTSTELRLDGGTLSQAVPFGFSLPVYLLDIVPQHALHVLRQLGAEREERPVVAELSDDQSPDGRAQQDGHPRHG